MSSSKKSSSSATTSNVTNKAVTLQDVEDVAVIEGSGNTVNKLDGGAIEGAFGFANDAVSVVESVFNKIIEQQTAQQKTALDFAGTASASAMKLAYDNVNPQIANAENTNKTLVYVMGMVAVVMFVGFGGLKKMGIN